MKHHKVPLIGLLVIAILITGCNKDSTNSTTSGKTSVKGPPVVDQALAFKGEEIYNQNCVFCHQEDAIGKPGIAPSLTNKEFLSIAPVDFLYDTIAEGRPGTGMPPFSHLGKDNIESIIAFIRGHAVLPDRIKEVDKQADAHGDARLGEQWFHQVCSTCHGPDGNGYAAGGTGTAIGKKGFLSKVSDGFIRTTIKEGRSNTRMLAFSGPAALADLSDQEIDDIITYLRTVPSKN
ncbi:MAG: c-type cytochrome [Gammaproteobacteria bacterium]|nr:c-type cytochrome [Gammaproteobacteria bacterium]